MKTPDKFRFRGINILGVLMIGTVAAMAAGRLLAQDGAPESGSVHQSVRQALDELEKEQEKLQPRKPAREPQAPSSERADPVAPEPADTPAPESREPEEQPAQPEIPPSKGTVETTDAIDAKGESSAGEGSGDNDAGESSSNDDSGRSYKLVKEGADSIKKEVCKAVLERLFPKTTRILLPMGVSLKDPVGVQDKAGNLVDSIGTADKYAKEHPEADALTTGVMFGLALIYEFQGPTPLKIAVAVGQIIIGGAEMALEEFTEKYLEDRARRLLVDQGGFFEYYANYMARGANPFYKWGFPKAHGLKKDLSNLSEVFSSPGQLTETWRLYVFHLRPLGGHEGGKVREDFDEVMGRAREILLEEWAEQVKMELVRGAKDYTDKALPDVEEDAAELLAQYRHAVRIVLETKERPFTFRGRVRGLMPASLKDRALLLKIDGKVSRAEVVTAPGTINDDGTYSATVRGILPRMSKVNGFAVPGGARGAYRRFSRPAALPVFPKLFAAFDDDRWTEVVRPEETVELDLDFGADPADECADLDPAGKGLEKGQYYAARERHEKCLKEGRSAVSAQDGVPGRGAGGSPGSDDAAAIASCVSQLGSLPAGCEASYVIANANFNAITCGKNGWVNFGAARPGSRMEGTMHTVDIDKDCRKRLLSCSSQKRFPCAEQSSQGSVVKPKW
ncbi:MAG: hypothetical protein HY927_10785 [Elusimicrobia bacterium]|nr:hypothetical protein [Elusimicrobiota bacterium]